MKVTRWEVSQGFDSDAKQSNMKASQVKSSQKAK